ncbi:MAG TPA: methyltransferase [Steroidobacteraceae bacterium]|nr:methyltransferase [Steroidobacteraceae bacterium]
MNATVLNHVDGAIRIEPLPDGTRCLSIEPRPGLVATRPRWVTRYPQELIEEILAAKGLYVCDEIMREEDPRYVEHYLRHEVLSYVPAEAFAGRRVLDFGCGSGASTLVLSRLLPPCELVGIELEERLLRIARLRAAHFGRESVKFLRSPSGDRLPEGIGSFDYIIFSAVFEHLLPAERPVLLGRIWDHLEPGGALFLNQTPHRFSPYEAHTTGLPLINYFPPRITLYCARRFSKRVARSASWDRLLRDGIRGGTVREIRSILGTGAELLAPSSAVGDRIDLWYRSLSKRHAWFKRAIWASLKGLKAVSRIELAPSLALAMRKRAQARPSGRH